MERTNDLAAGLAAAETMRSAAEIASRESEGKKEEEKVSIFWRVFGGTLLSIVALAAVTLFNNLSSSITELRSELNKERDMRAELVKKEEFNARISTQYERIRAAEGMQNVLTVLKGEQESLKEKSSVAAASLEVVKKETASLDTIRERIAALEAMKKELAGFDSIKEKNATLATDLRSTRDDLSKMTQELMQARSFDQERKALQDNRFKQYDETLKELTKGLQECREKLARLEVQQPKAPPMTEVKGASALEKQ